MTRDLRARETLRALLAGALVTLLVAVIFMVATRVWKGPGTWLRGESREDRFEIRLLWTAVLLLTAAVVAVPIRHTLLDGRGTSPAWLLQPFLVVAGAYLSAIALYGLFALVGNSRFFWTRGTRSLGGSYLAITLYGLIVAVLFAVLPAASYAAHAVGFAGVLAPIMSLVVGRVLMTRSVARSADRFTISKTLRHILLGIVVALLIGLTMIEVGALAIDQGFVNPLAVGGTYWQVLHHQRAHLLALSLIVNLNRIGLHYFYRDRILETYLRSEIANESKDERERDDWRRSSTRWKCGCKTFMAISPRTARPETAHRICW